MLFSLKVCCFPYFFRNFSGAHFPGHFTRFLLNHQALEWSVELSGKLAQHACRCLGHKRANWRKCVGDAGALAVA